MSGCLFCRIAAGAVPSSIVHRDERVLAFMDINQPTRGHVLVVPLAHSVDIHDIPAADATAVMEAARHVAGAVKRAVSADGIQLWQSNGRAAMQEIFHFHMHIFARFEDDDIKRLGMRAAAKFPPRPELDELAALIRQHMPAAG
ncbi:MAG: HIT domain-containing protein [Chloroflexi bacterium]|nr:HIT domain-containing protein [Chloroflexota bacterium]